MTRVDVNDATGCEVVSGEGEVGGPDGGQVTRSKLQVAPLGWGDEFYANFGIRGVRVANRCDVVRENC